MKKPDVFWRSGSRYGATRVQSPAPLKICSSSCWKLADVRATVILLLAPRCHSTSHNWLRSSWWRKGLWKKAANYAMHDSSLGSMLAKPQGLPLCVCRLMACVQLSPHPLPSHGYQNKCRAAHFNCLSVRPECLISCQVALNPPLLLPTSKRRLCWGRRLYTKRVFIPGFSLFLKRADNIVPFAWGISFLSEHLTHLKKAHSLVCVPCWEITVHRQLINKV